MFRLFFMLFTCVMLLSACQDKKERAERYYQSALSLLEEGDVERALLELRNVFDNDGMHKNARRLYADLLLERGDVQTAYSQYLRLVEQYPDEVEVRRTLAELALDDGNWNEVRRHASHVIALAPSAPEHKALQAILEYQSALEERDEVTIRKTVAEAQALLEENPNLEVALRLMIDWTVSGQNKAQALPYIDRFIDLHPRALSLHMTRLRVLDALGRVTETGDQLRHMAEQFPDTPEVVQLLTHWYFSRKEYSAAEAFLRQRAGTDRDNFEGHISVVQLLLRAQGPAAALAELDRLSAANADSNLGSRYKLNAALIRFEQNGETLIAEDIVTNLLKEISDPALLNDARLALSRIYTARGEKQSAQTLVNVILKTDPSHVQGLIARAVWRIQENSIGEAVTDLRLALDQDPRNADVLLLLAEAQQKLGNVELAEQRLAQAVEVSNGAPREALVYARFQLAQGGNPGAAEQVLTDSMRVSGDVEVARLLGQVLLQKGDVGGANNVLDQLVNSDNPNAAPLARTLQAAILFNQNRIDDSLAFLRSSAKEDANSRLETDLQILRIQMMSGRLDEARAHLETMQSQYPDSLALKLLEGNMLSLGGEPEGAIKVYRKLLTENPEQTIVFQRLYTTLRETGQDTEASELLVQTLKNRPHERPLNMLRALELEREGDVDAALTIYEGLYAANPDDIVVVNNLSSMLAYYRSSEADLERAHQIARRLNGSTEPALLDTLGYIQLRRGEIDTAVLNLQAAARGLPQEPTVAFNLAQAYAAAGRLEEARKELKRGFDLTAGQQNIPRLAEARALEYELNEAGKDL